MKYTSINSVFKTSAAACALLFGAGTLSAAITNFSGLIENPSDGGAGPGIWYSTTPTVNEGSAASGLTLTSNASIADPRTDFFGNASSAFGLVAEADRGAAIAGGGATSFLTGNQGTLVFTFRTPESMSTNASIMSRGNDSSPPNLELFMFASNGNLRMSLGNQERTTVGSLSMDTWYYFALTWDYDNVGDPVGWYLGEMAGANSVAGLNSGTLSPTSVGNPSEAIRFGGRNDSTILFGGDYQNIAIYDRELSSQAIQDQFTAIPEPSVYAGVVGLLALLMVYRRRKVN